ncbi:MAG: hypothetical protein OIN84_06440, partial [Candidatus Methanoperedens sp.]|nr:hypothetical protein [Candidatus Methanoperedens sp.]
RKTIRRLILITGVGTAVYLAFSLLALLAINVSFPTSETLAHWYLGEVTTGANPELRTPFLRCDVAYVEQDRARFGGADVRHIRVEDTPGTGSSDTIRFLTVTFDYRLPGRTDWQTGTINRLMSDFEPLRARRLMCVG